MIKVSSISLVIDGRPDGHIRIHLGNGKHAIKVLSADGSTMAVSDDAIEYLYATMKHHRSQESR